RGLVHVEQQLGEEVLLRAEVVVEAALHHAEVVGDVLHRRPAEPDALEVRRGCLEDRGPAIRPGLAQLGGARHGQARASSTWRWKWTSRSSSPPRRTVRKAGDRIPSPMAVWASTS